MRVITLVAAFFCLWCFAQVPTGKVVNVIGRAFCGSKALKPGDSVKVGDIIRTENDSGVKLLMADHTVLDIGASSRFKVGHYDVGEDGSRNVDLSLDDGSVRAAVSKSLSKKTKFFMRTKWSVLAVRGTEFLVRAGDDPAKQRRQEEVIVREGAVCPVELKKRSNDSKGESPQAQEGCILAGRFLSIWERAGGYLHTETRAISDAELGKLMKQSTLASLMFELEVGSGPSGLIADRSPASEIQPRDWMPGGVARLSEGTGGGGGVGGSSGASTAGGGSTAGGTGAVVTLTAKLSP